ncbi:hypothetical protein EE612_018128 [Oryza sativa]|uniref:Os03g0416400 protein n=1 Tax=Oryza sativa subsp. japonica TaxID=39947 RepID=Q0DR56_ORYSJ|nr:hypothetical protein EE612_018128 [Oryza sativa]BAF12282.2 Os03g0416400 [Oryza sativa Japonica Group]|eukprot:NP_001050368.2 Os03g0416400 [Oryza sativa Japonica Group]
MKHTAVKTTTDSLIWFCFAASTSPAASPGSATRTGRGPTRPPPPLPPSSSLRSPPAPQPRHHYFLAATTQHLWGERARRHADQPMRPRQCPRRILQWLRRRRRRRRQPRQPGRRAARHARQEGGAGRGRQHWVRSLQEAADRGRHRARWRGDWRRHGRDGAEQRQPGLEGGNGQPRYTAAVALAFVAASLGKGGWRGGGGGRWVAALFRRGSVERSSLQRVFGDATLRDTVAPLLRLPPPRRLRRDVRRRGHRHSRPLRRRAHGHRRGVGRGGGHGQPHRRRHHPSPPQQVGVPPRRRRRRPPRRLHRLRLLLQRRPFRHPVLQGPVAGVVGEADTEVAAAQEVAVEVAGHPVVASSRRMARQGEAGHTVDPAAEEEEDAGHRAAAGSGRGGGGAEEDADDHHARRPPRARKEK